MQVISYTRMKWILNFPLKTTREKKEEKVGKKSATVAELLINENRLGACARGLFLGKHTTVWLCVSRFPLVKTRRKSRVPICLGFSYAHPSIYSCTMPGDGVFSTGRRGFLRMKWRHASHPIDLPQFSTIIHPCFVCCPVSSLKRHQLVPYLFYFYFFANSIIMEGMKMRFRFPDSIRNVGYVHFLLINTT